MDTNHKDMLVAIGKSNHLRSCGEFENEAKVINAPVIEKGVILNRKGSVGRRNFSYTRTEKPLGDESHEVSEY